MGLRNTVIPAETVQISDGNGFTVRGLSPNDAMGLYHRHAGELSIIFDRVTGNIRQGVTTDVNEAVVGLIGSAPRILAEVIALATDSDPRGDDWEKDVGIALRLPAGVQADAVEKIGRMTFSRDMPPKKFLGLVLGMLGRTTAAMSAKPKG